MKELDKKILEQEQNMVKSLQRIVRIRSVENLNEGEKPFGTGVHKCFEEVLQMCGEMGFETFNMDDMTGWCEYGSGPEMIAVLGHLDVVPEADGWEYPPYAAIVKDNKVIGRGTIDDKGPVIASLYALKAIKDLNLPLKRRVRLIFGLNEETGAADMKYYRSHGGEIPVMGFTPDAEYPLINGEKGIINETYEKALTQTGDWRILSIKGGVAGNVTPDYARMEISCPEGVCLPQNDKIRTEKQKNGWKIEAEGISAHGSQPEKGENAIGRLAKYAKELPFTGEGAEAIGFLADKIGMECHGESMGCALEDELSGKLSFNLGTISGNANYVQIKLNYRYPVTCKYEQCEPIVKQQFETAGWNLVEQLHKPKLYVPQNTKLVQSLLKVYREKTGDFSSPKCIGGGTYAKAIPNIVAFGPLFHDDEVLEHKPNEYIRIDRLVQNAQIIAAAIVELANE